MTRGTILFRLGLGLLAFTMMAGGAAVPATAQSLPEIRISERSKVPACITPDRLMQFLRSGNEALPGRFSDIAAHYKRHGEANRVRWDYAFFQMILETNYLKFKNAAGQGDVDPKQNNFAGIGTTGGGVPGDSFPDVSTGVLAQIQHLMAYSGERVESPVGRRTREKQDEIIQRSRMLGRNVTFRDLTRRWAVDHRYGSSIANVASRFHAEFCKGRKLEEDDASPALTNANADDAKARAGNGRARAKADDDDDTSAVSLAERSTGRDLARRAVERGGEGAQSVRAGLGVSPPTLVEAPRPAPRPTGCRVFTASYGGERNVLIRVIVGAEYHYTALQVVDGQEERLAQTFIAQHARGGDAIGEFPSRDAALGRAFDLCPAADKQGPQQPG